MEVRKASPADLQAVGDVTRSTIAAIYPHYYPQGSVDFFLDWHRDETILEDIEAGRVYLLTVQKGRAVGTVTLHEGEITRLYVLPGCQGKGYGSMLLDFAEKAVGEAYGKIRVEASLPAQVMYWKRGYRVVDFLTEAEGQGDVLCWAVMEKPWGAGKSKTK